MVIRTPTPLQLIQSEAANTAGVQWLIKRDDLIHPQISGNKWRKLKYNLQLAQNQGLCTLVTFGGAYSNHLYAVAATGKLMGFQTVGIIRGERSPTLSSTLQFAESCGMQLEFWSRQAYAYKEEASDFQHIQQKYNPFYLIPEGGSNGLAVQGCAEIVKEITAPFDYLTCPCGTGATVAGLITGSNNRGTVIGFAALKGGGFLQQEVEELLANYYVLKNENHPVPENWRIETDYHFGGYAKYTPGLLDFIRRFESENPFLIEQVYTAKMLFGVEDLLRQGAFRRGETIISVHTGGLQGRLILLDQ
jgi:1-aminocyclopropane-1-carboxylate deaminase